MVACAWEAKVELLTSSQEAEVVVSQDCTTALQPWVMQWDSISNKTKQNEKPAWARPSSLQNILKNQLGVVLRTGSLTYSEGWGGGFLEPRRSRLQWTIIVPLHSSLGDRSEIVPSKKPEMKYHVFMKVKEDTYLKDNISNLNCHLRGNSAGRGGSCL